MDDKQMKDNNTFEYNSIGVSSSKLISQTSTTKMKFSDIKKKYSYIKYVFLFLYFSTCVLISLFFARFFFHYPKLINITLWKGTNYKIILVLIWLLLFIVYIFFLFATYTIIFMFVYSSAWLILHKQYKKNLVKLSQESKIYDFSYEELPTVAIVVPVFNDFCPHQITQSFKQTYKKCLFFILDDSTDKETILKIDDFSLKNNVKIIRRDKTKSMYKNGLSAAFDHFLQTTKNEWDFMVHVDSGDIISANHVESNIPLFLADEKIGGICPVYSNFKTKSLFSNIFGITNKWLFNSAYLSAVVGTRRIPGAGVIYSKLALEAIGKWPDLVCEDTATAFSIQKKGFYTIFSNLSVMGELFPDSLQTYKSRSTRWERSNLQIINEGFIDFKKKNSLINNLFEISLSIFYPFFPVVLAIVSILLFLVKFPADFSADFKYFSSDILNIFAILVGVFFLQYIPIMLTCLFSINKNNWKYNIIYFFTSIFFISTMFIHNFILSFVYIYIKKKDKFIITKKDSTKNDSLWKNIKTSVYWIVAVSLVVSIFVLFKNFIDDQKLWTLPQNTWLVFSAAYLSIIGGSFFEIVLHIFCKFSSKNLTTNYIPECSTIQFFAPLDKTVNAGIN